MSGRVIVLNGTSSAGKTTLGMALQRLLDPPPLILGIDFFLAMLPPVGHMGMSFDQRTNENGGGDEAALRWVFPDNPDDGVRIEAGEPGQRLMRGMHRSIAALASAGSDVIFDHVLLEPSWLDDLIDALDGLDVTFVGIRCPLDVVEERERQRGHRVIGQARGHFDIVHAHGMYDIEVDTSQLSARDAAQAIADHLHTTAPSVFERLRAARRR
jgi:chloramphenicol 3-O phosphotransferase